MAVTYEKVVAEDLDLGAGTVTRTMPGGGTVQGTQINLGTFAPQAGVTLASLGAASSAANVGRLVVISDSNTSTPGATPTGGGSTRALIWSNGSAWKVVMA